MSAKSFRGYRFILRAYPPRIIAFALAFLCIAAVLHQGDTHPLVWFFAIIHGLIWPHIAFLLARRARTPYKAEKFNFLCDAFGAGLWLPVIEFNIMPSYAIVSMICMALMAVGGFTFFINGLLMIAVGIAVSSLFVGLSFSLQSSDTIVYLTLPYIIVFPLVVSMITYRLAVQLSRQKKQLEKLKREDELSGLFNRVYWEEQVANEFRRFQRVGNRSSVILLDVDNFKHINDCFGHKIGDMVISHVGEVINQNLRNIDVAGRYGGEEFGIILPDTDCAAAQHIAERLRRNLENTPFRAKPKLRFTVSIGVVELAEDLPSYSQWLERADAALYCAKLNGRNRTEVANKVFA
ncbi:MAG: diguanylate cyclase [Exilibacterium sp.]